ncbi:MAG: hypothetical protein IKB62_04275 [Oscillospiraceae bacterium]|nr:hypothetical protein [Oscillospiraceae bacterium]
MNNKVAVTVGQRTYSMTRQQFKEGIEPLAKKAVPFGIYAVEKAGHIQMLKEKFTSITQLKQRKREYTASGYKVYVNQEK